MAFPTGWGRKQIITIASAEVAGSGSHTDFPVLITLDHLDTEIVDAGSNSALNGGGDIRFSSDSAGSTQLACEIVDFVTDASAGNRVCVIWVLVPTLSTSSDTEIYIWYKKSGESQPAVTDTYGRNAVWADYEAVLHDCQTDSTGNLTFTPSGSPTTGVTDPLGGSDAVTFDGSNDYIRSSAVSYAGDQIPLWIQAWAKVVTVGDTAGVVGLFDSGAAGQWQALQQDFDQIGVLTRSGGNITAANTGLPTSTLTTDWHKFDGVFAATNDRLGYMDGTDVGTASTTFTWSNTLDRISIGRWDDSSPSSYFDGDLYDVRVRLYEPSADWITTEYNNQSDPASFAGGGTPEDAGGGGGSTILPIRMRL